ncbi:MAG: hypothetical protein GXY43_04160 [Clostridiaceae bacterium]|nr:hypothetical protein [Clostridiaceae bacterium]
MNRKNIARVLCPLLIIVLVSGCVKIIKPDQTEPTPGTSAPTEQTTTAATLTVETTEPEATVPPPPIRLGVNLEGASDWNSGWPTNDIMKCSRSFFTQNTEWVEGGKNEWDTGYIERIPMGDHGYPLELPAIIKGAEAPQMITTVWANTSAMPEGDYQVYYDGIGEIGFGMDATGEVTGDGRMVMHLTHRDNIASMFILESSAGDPIRNIRILLPGADPEELFNRVFLEKCEPFAAIRFMDWGQTNNSPLVNWDDRAKPEDSTFTAGKGFPYEYMIELANTLHKDIWVCIPHKANDEYISGMAKLFGDGLDPELTLYVEYSNEVWNWMFDQAHYLLDEGDQGVDWPERCVPIIENALDVFSENWTGDPLRLKRVLGIQIGYYDVSERIARNMRPGSFDLIAPTAYFGFSESAIRELENAGSGADMDLLRRLAEEAVVEMGNEIRNIAELCDRLGVGMAYYEAGQHLTPEPFGSEQDYNPALVAFQHDPAMYDIYMQMFEKLEGIKVDKNGDTTLCMLFSLTSADSGQYGSWGLLTDIFGEIDLEDVPKYRAVLDYMNGMTESFEG